MSQLSTELRSLIESGPLAHLATINEDGSAQVTGIWIGLDGDDVVSAHMSHKRLVQNIERDPRVVLSFSAPAEPGAFLIPYAVLRATATVAGPSEEAWELLNRLAKVYVAADAEFPAPRGPGYLVRHKVERVSGVGPWQAQPHSFKS
jgi:PPOX class probable F420-dependent enzyme